MNLIVDIDKYYFLCYNKNAMKRQKQNLRRQTMKKKFKLLTRTLCTVLSFVVLFGVFIFPTSAAETSGIMDGRVYALISYATGEAIDVPGGYLLSRAYLSDYTYSYQNLWQRWAIRYEGGNDYVIVDMHSRNLLSIEGSSIDEGAKAWTYYNDGTTGQRFKIVNNGDGTFSFLSKCTNYTKALAVQSNGNIIQTTFTGAARQKFYLVLPGYVYNLQNVNSGKSLDVSAANTANGSDVAQYITTPESLWQRWCIKYIGNGEYKIMDMNSGKLLSISGSSTANKANCHIWADDGTTGQIFKIVQNSDGTLTFLSKCSGYTKALGVLNSGTANGDTVVQLTADGSNNQKFRFTIEAESKSPEGLYIIRNSAMSGFYIRKNRGLSNVVEQHSFDGEYDQIWELEYDCEKYYKIVNKDENEEKLLTVPASYSNEKAVSLEDEWTDTNRKRQLWILTVKENGTYWLQSKYHEEYEAGGGPQILLALGDSNGSGVNVEQRNDGVRTYWNFKSGGGRFFAVTAEAGHEHILSLSYSQSLLNSIGEFGYVESGTFSVLQCKEALKQSEIFISRSHGAEVKNGNDDGQTTYILLINDKSSMYGLHGSYCYSKNDLNTIVNDWDNFYQLELAVFVGCQTGVDTIGENLCEAVVSHGAEVAVGFTTSMQCTQANDWTDIFMYNIAAGKSVNVAVNLANQQIPIGGVVFGNGNYVFN